jgi:hypothetical protein
MMDYLSGKLFKCSGKETRHKAALGLDTRQRSGLAAGRHAARIVKAWKKLVIMPSNRQ